MLIAWTAAVSRAWSSPRAGSAAASWRDGFGADDAPFVATFLADADDFSVPLARRIVAVASRPSADLNRAGREFSAVSPRILSRGFAFGRRAVAVAGRTAARDDPRDDPRRGGITLETEPFRRAVR